MGDARRFGGKRKRIAEALIVIVTSAIWFACGSAAERQETNGGSGGVSSSSGGASQGGAAGVGRGGRAGSAGDSQIAGSANSDGIGEAGRAGAPGTAGSSGCSVAAITACDDQDPCTQEELDDACACSRHALTEAASCDDQDVCTHADHCSAGICAGTRAASDPQVTARLRSFGEGPGLQTLVAFPASNRVIFARDRRLTLLALDGDVATVLDDIPMTAPVRSDGVGSMIWASRPRTFVIPVLEHYLAVASIDRGIDLFDIAGDKLKPSETYGFGGGGTWPIVAVTGAAARLYACKAFEVQTWNIEPTTQAISPGPTLQLTSGHRCQGLALAPDHGTLFAATNGGLEQIAIDSDGALKLQSEARQGNLVVDVQSNADAVAIFEVRDPTSGFGNVVVLRRDNLQEIANFNADLGPLGASPVGFSLLDGKRILLQTVRADANGCALHEAITSTLASPPVELDRRTTFNACQSPFSLSSFHTVASGPFAVLEPMHQLVEVGASDGKMRLINAPQQGAFERVRAGGPRSVLVYSSGSLHRVDISDPRAPRVEAGGLPSPLTWERLRVDLTDPTSASVLTISDAAQGGPTGPLTTVLRAVPGGLPSVFASIANDDPDGPWTSAGTALYQLSTRGAANFRLRRFRTASIVAASGQTLSADLDQEVVTAAPSALDARRTPLVRADAESGDLLVLEPRSNSTVFGSDRAVLSRYSIEQGRVQTRFSQQLEPGLASSLASSASHSVVLMGGQLLAVDQAGNRTRIQLFDSTGLAGEDILAMDSEKLVLAVSWTLPSPTPGALLLRADDFSELARYATTELPRSFAAVGEHWVFGARSSLFVTTPACVIR